MVGKEWFVILTQGEFERIKTPTQLAVYMAIKSFTANGKQKIDLSFRDIQRRCKVSVGWIKPVIQKLIGLDLVFTHGTLGRRGGECQVFSVGTVNTPGSVHSVASSVHSVASSVQSSASKLRQSNKVKSNSNGINKNFISKLNNQNFSLKEKSSQPSTPKRLPKDFFDNALDLAEKLSTKKVEEERWGK